MRAQKAPLLVRPPMPIRVHNPCGAVSLSEVGGYMDWSVTLDAWCRAIPSKLESGSLHLPLPPRLNHERRMGLSRLPGALQLPDHESEVTAERIYEAPKDVYAVLDDDERAQGVPRVLIAPPERVDLTTKRLRSERP